MKDLETKRTFIRKFKMEDANEAYENLGKNGVSYDSVRFPMHKSIIETRKIIETAMKDYNNLEGLVWAIEEKYSNILIGCIKLINICSKNRSCEIIWLIERNHLYKGYSKEVLEEVVKYLIEEKNMIRITVKFYENNKILIPILEQIGMKKEGKLRNERFNKSLNKWEDLFIYSIIEEDYNNISNKRICYN